VTSRRVLISTSSFGVADTSPLERLEREGFEVSLNPHGRVLTEDEIAALIAEVDGLIAGTEPLSDRVLAEASRLRVISRVGVGIERIDLEAAERRGVQVFITPDALTDAVAEITIGAMLTLLRGIHQMNTALHDGRWEKSMGQLLRGKTVGIVGLGRIGKAVVDVSRVGEGSGIELEDFNRAFGIARSQVLVADQVHDVFLERHGFGIALALPL